MKQLVAVGCALAGLFFGAAAADAGPASGPTLVLDPPTVAPGGTVIATLEDFCTGVDPFAVEIAIDGGDSTIVSCQPDGLVATLTAPSTPGDYDVRASIRRRGGDTPLAVTTLVVQSGAPGLGEPLPDTGPDSTITAITVGASLLVGGSALLAAARRRRSAAS